MHRALVTVLVGVLPVLQHGVVHAAPAQDQHTFALRVLDLTNSERQKAGLVPLTLNPQLEDAAESYSELLASSGCFGHTCGPVPDFVERDGQAGYTAWTNVGENIAAGYSNPEDVVAGWMDSPGHRANILSPAYTEMGVGVTNGDGKYGTYWAEEFGTRESVTDQAAAGADSDLLGDDSEN